MTIHRRIYIQRTALYKINTRRQKALVNKHEEQWYKFKNTNKYSILHTVGHNHNRKPSWCDQTHSDYSQRSVVRSVNTLTNQSLPFTAKMKEAHINYPVWSSHQHANKQKQSPISHNITLCIWLLKAGLIPALLHHVILSTPMS